MFRKLNLALILLLLSSAAFAASPGKIETCGVLSDSAVPETLRSAVADGQKLTLYDGSVVQIWLAKSVPQPKEKDPNAVFPQLSRSTFLGIIRFERQAKDFRGQPLKPGIYAMRYELLPTDGNHMGVSPQPDFVLLTPISADTDPNATYDFAQLVELSAKAAGTSHPASLSMVPADDVTTFPSLFYTSDGYVAYAAKIKTAAGDTPIALVVKGIAQQ